ncbi:MAG: glycine betaine ABC transporter substrate-binding protein [Calditrichaceae bacterium]
MFGKTLIAVIILILFCIPVFADASQSGQVVIGSKKFTESVVLGEIVNQMLQSSDVNSEHRKELGGTRILWNSLLNGEIDIYPEYTGTIMEEILNNENISNLQELNPFLRKFGVGMTRSLGFSNTYAIGMREVTADNLKIRSISDLKNFPDLKVGFTNEFMDRGDGWPGLRGHYHLPQKMVTGLDHDLAYKGLNSGSIQVMDLYSTDAEIAHYNLRVLKDDLHYFTDYKAVLLYRLDLDKRVPDIIGILQKLEGRISENDMIHLNSLVRIDGVPEEKTAAEFVSKNMGIDTKIVTETIYDRISRHTWEHLYLVIISLSAAILVSIPLGIAATANARIGTVILGAVGIIQTIPSLALLVFMIPLLGIGGPPAIVALFLYSLLPIVRNTYTGIHDIPGPISESARALGLRRLTRLWRIELPMASASILAGIKTSAVINIGTATLGALIGAGGYGQPILTGIRLDNTGLILQGAVPAALLALMVQWGFDLADRVLIPKGLRIKASE